VAANPIYRKDPLALVLTEIRHPVCAPPEGAILGELKRALSSWTPIEDREVMKQINVETGEQHTAISTKLVSRDRRTAVTFRQDAMTVEITDYPGWEVFRALTEALITARQDIAPVDGCFRIGLRYINEIRLPSGYDPSWSRYVSDGLIGPHDKLAKFGFHPEEEQHALQCTGSVPGDALTLRYGVGRGAVIQSTPTLRRRTEPSQTASPFFLIDLDGSWTDSEGAVPELTAELVVNTLDRVHQPVRNLFESLITDNLRTVFD
jgi:uncharacterized protein (TIGR04255 family)